MKIHDLANEARDALIRGEREAPGIGKVLVRRDSREEWIAALCHEAHGDLLPDDWRYEFIGDALDCIGEREDCEDDDSLLEAFREWVDGGYVYTGERLAWLVSHPSRIALADEAAEEFGLSGGIMERVAVGMLREAEEVYKSVLSSLRRREEETEGGAGTEAEPI